MAIAAAALAAATPAFLARAFPLHGYLPSLLVISIIIDMKDQKNYFLRFSVENATISFPQHIATRRGFSLCSISLPRRSAVSTLSLRRTAK
jgi:hypothetical protein